MNSIKELIDSILNDKRHKTHGSTSECEFCNEADHVQFIADFYKLESRS